MFQGITTVAFYDTLGVDATKFIINQTELTTMAVSIDFVSQFAQMKLDDLALDPSE